MIIRLVILIVVLMPVHASAAAEYSTNSQTCYGFPRIVGMKTPPGSCVGLVASKKSVNWSFPRKIAIHKGTAYVSAYGGWKVGNGQLWKIDLTGQGAKISSLLRGTDRTHGVRVGPEGKIYYGDATAIYRFAPERPEEVETVIQGLPDSYRLSNGKTVASNHPLSEFIFLSDGSIVVNVGAPSNDCSEEFKLSKACAQRDSQAEVRLYNYDPRSGEFDPAFVRLARGLRNSMGLLFNPETNEVYQAENASDAPGTPDELNVIDLNVFDSNRPFDFGWPFCFASGERYGIYTAFRSFCAKTALKPALLLPAHAAPLDMMYATGRMFPELAGKILVSYHGHRPSGSRIAVFATDSSGRPSEFETYFVDGWQADSRGRFPKGAPVGIAEDENGALFMVDDKNHVLLVVVRSSEAEDDGAGNGERQEVTERNLEQTLSRRQVRAFEALFAATFVRTSCAGCHGDVVVNSSPRRTLVNLLNNGWVRTGAPIKDQTLWQRLSGEGGVRIMPPPNARPLDATGLNSVRSWLRGL